MECMRGIAHETGLSSVSRICWVALFKRLPGSSFRATIQGAALRPTCENSQVVVAVQLDPPDLDVVDGGSRRLLPFQEPY